MGYYSHDMKINSHVMRIVFLSALQQNFECTGKVFGAHWNFKYAAMRPSVLLKYRKNTKNKK